MNIKLPPVVIAGLYKDCLVLAEEKSSQPVQLQVTDKKITADEKQSPLNKKWFLGDNKKNIVILLKEETAVHISDDCLATLGKLLNACKLTLADVAIVNFARQPKPFGDLKEMLQPRVVLLFDVTTKDIELPFTIPFYQVQQYAGCTVMTAPQLTISSNASELVKGEKRKLWEKLQQIFQV